MDDVLVNKGAIIERCLVRVAEEYAKNPARWDFATSQYTNTEPWTSSFSRK